MYIYTLTHFCPVDVLHQPIQYSAQTQLVFVVFVFGVFIIVDADIVFSSLCLVFYPYSTYIFVCIP